jgi:hypothetical protein
MSVLVVQRGNFSALVAVEFCEGKYGGSSSLPLGEYFPEYVNALTGFFIAFVGVHMLLANQHDSQLLKVIAANFTLNGVASFYYHWTGYASALDMDGYLMLCSVWLSMGFVLEVLSSYMVNGPLRWSSVGRWDALGRRRMLRRVVRCVYWLAVCAVPSAFLFALQQPLQAYVGSISPWFYAAFIMPLVLMFAVNVAFMHFGVHSATLNRFPDSETGVRTFASARRRFFCGLTIVLIGVSAWLLSEGLCDRHEWLRGFPGHAIFHVTMSYGLLQCLIYPSILRASTYGAHPRFLDESDHLQPRRSAACSLQPRGRSSSPSSEAGEGEERDGRGAPAEQMSRKERAADLARRAALGYLFLFPAISFVKVDQPEGPVGEIDVHVELQPRKPAGASASGDEDAATSCATPAAAPTAPAPPGENAMIRNAASLAAPPSAPATTPGSLMLAVSPSSCSRPVQAV